MAQKQKTPTPRALFKYEYVTSAVSVLKGDGIVVHVVNDSGTSESAHVIIYQNTGAGAITAADSGVAAVIPTWTWGLGFTVAESEEYWVRAQVTSEFQVPRASFQRVSAGLWLPFVDYRPGDFAVFDLLPTRKRRW